MTDASHKEGVMTWKNEYAELIVGAKGMEKLAEARTTWPDKVDIACVLEAPPCLSLGIPRTNSQYLVNGC